MNTKPLPEGRKYCPRGGFLALSRLEQDSRRECFQCIGGFLKIGVWDLIRPARANFPSLLNCDTLKRVDTCQETCLAQ